MTAHIAQSGHKLCGCGGYHYKHRPGSPCCERNPQSLINAAKRDGASDDDLAELYWHVRGVPSVECPF